MKVDLQGALSEAVVLDALEENGFEPRGYVLLRKKPKRDPDFTLGHVRYNIKSTDGQFLTIPERWLKNPMCDYVLPAIIMGNNRIVLAAPVPVAEIRTWELRHGHSDYRSINRSCLKRLCSLYDLPGAPTVQ